MKLCKDCARFIHMNSQCGRSKSRPDYVFGAQQKTISAQNEREFDVEDGCGPSAKFFVPIVVAIDYADLARRAGT